MTIEKAPGNKLELAIPSCINSHWIQRSFDLSVLTYDLLVISLDIIACKNEINQRNYYLAYPGLSVWAGNPFGDFPRLFIVLTFGPPVGKVFCLFVFFSIR